MAAGGEIVAKYVGHKIAKARWSPPRPDSLQPSDTFITGGWDDQRNKLCVWKTEDALQDSGKGMTGVPNEPNLICEVEHIGDVTDVQYSDPERILVASSTGSVSLYQYNPRKQTIQPEQTWAMLHHHTNHVCSCTSLTTSANTRDIVTAGEDGRINILRLDQQHPVRTIDSADSTSINGVSFTTANEVAAVTFSGQVKLWDLRQATNKPARTMLIGIVPISIIGKQSTESSGELSRDLKWGNEQHCLAAFEDLSGDRVPLLCVDKHPTQPHLLAAGGQDGVLSIWDMRQEQYPVTLLEGHRAELWEVKFHPQKPDHLFTCSEDGSLWQWDGTSMATPSLTSSTGVKPGFTPGNLSNGVDGYNAASPWLSVDATKHRMETYSLLSENRLSINCLDIESKHLLCGCDCEAIFIIHDLIIR